MAPITFCFLRLMQKSILWLMHVWFNQVIRSEHPYPTYALLKRLNYFKPSTNVSTAFIMSVWSTQTFFTLHRRGWQRSRHAFFVIGPVVVFDWSRHHRGAQNLVSEIQPYVTKYQNSWKIFLLHLKTNSSNGVRSYFARSSCQKRNY